MKVGNDKNRIYKNKNRGIYFKLKTGSIAWSSYLKYTGGAISVATRANLF